MVEHSVTCFYNGTIGQYIIILGPATVGRLKMKIPCLMPSQWHRRINAECFFKAILEVAHACYLVISNRRISEDALVLFPYVQKQFELFRTWPLHILQDEKLCNMLTRLGGVQLCLFPPPKNSTRYLVSILSGSSFHLHLLVPWTLISDHVCQFPWKILQDGMYRKTLGDY